MWYMDTQRVIIVVQLFWREREADVPALSTFYEKLGSAWRKKDNILAAAPHYLVPVTMIDAYIHVCIQFFHNPKNPKIGWKLKFSKVIDPLLGHLCLFQK